MSKKTNYYFLTPADDNLNFIDFGLNYGNITTVGDTIQFSGTSRVDSVFVRPGMTYDLSDSGPSADKIYLGGSLADYAVTISGLSLTLKRTVGGVEEVVTVASGTSLAHDNLVFADGTVSTNQLFTAVQASSAKPTPDPSETSGSPSGAAASNAALSSTIKAVATGTATVGEAGQTFATTKPGINFVVVGGSGVDTVYVANGEVVDATALGMSVDLIYLRGNWADYTKTVLTGGTQLQFTRQVGGKTESVTVLTGTVNQSDKLIFADGAVTTINAKNAVAANPATPITGVTGNDPSTTTPLYTDQEVAAALNAIKTAAQNNSATDTTPSAATYATAGVKGVTTANLASINNALDSTTVDGSKADTAAKVQAIVDAYNAVLAAADGTAGSTPLSGDTYAAVGVTGVAGTTPVAGSALALMDNVVDVAGKASVDTVAELQAIADAAAHVMAAAGGTPVQVAALTLDDLKALGITGVTPANLLAVQSAIAAVSADTGVDTQAELQSVVSVAIAGISAALNKIQTAAQNNIATAGDATHTALTVADYKTASIAGVDTNNLAAINSALDSAAVTGAQASTGALVQAIVDAYNAILASADGAHSPAAPVLGADVYTAIGVTGLGTASGPGSTLALLDDVVDLSAQSAVDTQAEVQALASAAGRVMQGVGTASADQVTAADLTSLGIVGVTSGNLATVQSALQGLSDPKLVDTQYELQILVNTALGKVALNVIAAAAQNNTATASLTATSYGAAGVTGVTASNLSAINSALDSAAVDGARADTLPKVQAIVDAYNAILNGADGTAGSTPITVDQYSAIGVTGVAGTPVDGSALHLLDDVVDLSAKSAVDTVAEVQALADASTHVMGLIGHPLASASVQDLNALLGNTSVSAANLAAIQTALQGASATAVDTRAELQAFVNNVINTVVPNALSQIQNAALNNVAASGDSMHLPLSAATFGAAGVTGVEASNLTSINSALDSAAVSDNQVNTTPKVQIIVDSYKAILSNADGWADNDPALTGDVFAAVGVTGLPTGASTVGSALSLLSSTVDQSAASNVDTVSELQAMANAAKHVLGDVGATGTSTTTLLDLQALNITGVTPGNLAAVQAAIKALASPNLVDTQGELQRLVDGLLGTTGAAVLKISAAAESNTAAGATGVPDLMAADYVAAGVTGVTSTNLASINSALNSAPINGDTTDTTAEIQAVVDGYNAILASADQTLNAVNPLSAAQYASIGVTGLSGPYANGNALHLLDDVLDQSALSAVDTVPEVQALTDAAKAVITAATTGSSGPVTLVNLQALGITGVSVDSLAAVQSAIAASGLDGTGVDTLAELQAVVNGGVTAAANALTVIQAAAQNNSASDTTPSAATYAAAGVTGVTATNLAAINSALNSTAVAGAQADTTAEVQAIVSDYSAILASADGTAGNTATPLTAAQYTDVGVTGVSAGSALNLLDNVVDGKASTAVDTVPELQALADAAKAVMTGAAAGTAPTLPQLSLLGITGVTADNLAAVQAAIAATNDDGTGVDTLAELQAVVNGGVTAAANALTVIQVAAQNNSASDTTPSAATYAAAGVTGVTATNLAAINSALNSTAVAGAQADTTAEVQAIVSDYSAILASADGTAGNTATPLTAAQYTDIGVTGVSAGSALNLLDNVVDGKASTAVDTVPELQALADAANHVMNIVASGTGTAPSVDDFVNLGITGVTALNLSTAQAAIAHTTSANVDTVAELQAVINGGLSHPTFSTSLGGVSNLDVTSNLVLSVDQTVTIGHGNITITDLGGSNSGTGYHGDVNTNTQVIDVATAVANGLLILSGTGANTKIIINPKWDLDLSSNYQVTIDDGAFMNAAGTQAAAHFSPVNFSTVKPGTHSSGGTVASEAVASQLMQDSGILAAGKSWMDIEGIGNNTGGMTQLGSLGGGSYALVMKNYATVPGGSTSSGGDTTDGIATHDTNVGFINFGNNDVLYFDSQVNDASKQRFDANYSIVVDGGASNMGGVAGQNTLTEGLVPVPQQQGGQAYIALGLEGNTANSVYGAVYDLPGTPGFANAWHNQSPPLIMG